MFKKITVKVQRETVATSLHWNYLLMLTAKCEVETKTVLGYKVQLFFFSIFPVKIKC